MDERDREFDLARNQLAPQWSAERSARLYAATLQLGRKRSRRRTAAWASVSFAAAALLGVGLGRWYPLAAGSERLARSDRAAAPAMAHSVRLADGSRADLLGSQSELATVEDSPERVTLKLVKGRAHFDVVPNPLRSFSVEAAPYRVQVVGTVFDVERDGSAVRVTVARGHVRVFGPSGVSDLLAGQQQRFAPADPIASSSAAPPRAPPAPARENEHPAVTKVEPKPRRATAVTRGNSGSSASMQAQPAGHESWRSLSQSGQYEAAFESLRQSAALPDDPAALMDAADAARLSGHAQNAAEYLSKVARGHRDSPVAPLAAFTLGRVYLEELGQPDLAAAAFELSRTLAPNGSMAQDALAREVESLSKAGNARKAYVRAKQYLERFPGGSRVRAVQLYGGLE